MSTRLVSFILLPAVVLLGFLSWRFLRANDAVYSPAWYLPTPRPSEECDICEPNNAFKQACGPLAPSTSYQYPIRCTFPPDEDYYYIDLATSGEVILDLTSIPAGADYDIRLYNQSGVLKCYSLEPCNADEHVHCSLSQPGRYYIKVSAYSGGYDCITTVCNNEDPYMLTVAYPTPPPMPVATPTSQPPCNVHIDDFDDGDIWNDLHKPFGWALDPPGCGSYSVEHIYPDLKFSYVLTPPCTLRYTSTLAMSADPYQALSFRIQGETGQEPFPVSIGLSDQAGHVARVRISDFLNRVVTDTWQTWQGVSLPLAAFATQVDTSQLNTFLMELTNTQGTIHLDSLRLERPRSPLVVDNFNDLADPNALGGNWSVFYDFGGQIQATYTTSGTHDNSAGSYALSYTTAVTGWAGCKTDLPGLDVSSYDFLSFYIKGAKGGEKVNVYLKDTDNQRRYVDVETYAPVRTDWTLVRVPLQAFRGVTLTSLNAIEFAFEWEPMTGTVFLDDLRFDADPLQIDNFCDDDPNNSLNQDVGMFTLPSCGMITPTLTNSLRLDYDVTGGSGCFSGYYSRTPLDINPYRSLSFQVKGERCGEVAAIAAGTQSVSPDKVKLSNYLLDGITDQWQQVAIPLAAYLAVADWTRGDAYSIAFEANRGASKGTTYWDDIAFTMACSPLWVDNFNDEDNLNALGGTSGPFVDGVAITMTASITQAYGDTGAGLAVLYSVPQGKYAGWETQLRDVNVSNYAALAFNIKSSAGGASPNIYLTDGIHPRQPVPLEKYVRLSTDWQTAIIPLTDFFGLDRTRLQALQVIIEYQSTDVQGTLFLDNIRFLPSTGCSQPAHNNVYLPFVAKHYTPPTIPYPLVWDFESGTEGWTHRTYLDSQAIIAVEASTYRSLSGNASLAMIMDLVGGDAHKSQGEAYVALNTPVNVKCKPISCWVYVPTCGVGDSGAPNQIQLFAKDAQNKSEYGTPVNVVRNEWFQVTFRPSTVQPYNGFMDPLFDPTKISLLGVKFRAGSPQNLYRGKVYLDACG